MGGEGAGQRSGSRDVSAQEILDVADETPSGLYRWVESSSVE